MDKRLIICIVVILGFAFLAILAYQYLEIYPIKTQTLPSVEALSNDYYAIERWLNDTGHPVRTNKYYRPVDIVAAHENAAVVFSSSCIWEDTDKHLLPWIEKGNSLVICINYINGDENIEKLLEFVKGLGIDVSNTSISGDWDLLPYFDMTVQFLIDEDFNPADAEDYAVFTINDNQGFTRLVQVSLGKGKLTLTGNPLFMQNDNLKETLNANLAWELTGARTADENPGVFFVRSNYRRASSSMFGKIMENGNLVPVGISALLLIVFGFWSVIPVFGLVFHEKQKKSRPIKERFSAEIKFLKKYKALDYYIETYKRELQFNDVSWKNEKYNYGEIINKIRSVHDGTNKFKCGIRGFKA
jgi:hypothetical protein